LLFSTGVGCYSVPPGKSAISKVTIEGAPSIDKDELADRITTRGSKSILGVYGFIYDYELFDRYAVRRDLARIERYMQARGFYDARVRVAQVVPDGNKVHVTIEVEEGRPIVVDSILIEGDEAVSAPVRASLRAAIEAVLPSGARLDEEKLEEAEKAAQKALSSRGYAYAVADRHTEIDLASATA